jgi:hypothetical protein
MIPNPKAFFTTLSPAGCLWAEHLNIPAVLPGSLIKPNYRNNGSFNFSMEETFVGLVYIQLEGLYQL